MGQATALINSEYDNLYTLEEARNIVRLEEMRQRLEQDRIKQNEKKDRRYFAKQRLAGFGLLAISTIILTVTKDATASIFLYPIGLIVMTTKNKVICL